MPSTFWYQNLPLLPATCLKWTADGELSAEDRMVLLLPLERVNADQNSADDRWREPTEPQQMIHK